MTAGTRQIENDPPQSEVARPRGLGGSREEQHRADGRDARENASDQGRRSSRHGAERYAFGGGAVNLKPGSSGSTFTTRRYCTASAT